MCIDWNAVSAIATATATCVALYASFQARSETRLAIKMQEQSKNVSLLDKRIELAENIQSGRFVLDFVSETTLEALFNKEIFAQYEVWKRYTEKRKQLECELKEFDEKTKISDAEGGFLTVKEAIASCETEREKCEFSQDLLDRYIEISEQIKAAERNENKEKDSLLQLMREFTKKSIEPLDAKKRGRS